MNVIIDIIISFKDVNYSGPHCTMSLCSNINRSSRFSRPSIFGRPKSGSLASTSQVSRHFTKRLSSKPPPLSLVVLWFFPFYALVQLSCSFWLTGPGCKVFMRCESWSCLFINIQWQPQSAMCVWVYVSLCVRVSTCIYYVFVFVL